MKLLFLIPARGGSKGLPNKNIRLLSGKPLIAYSIEAALDCYPDSEVCVSTDSLEIGAIAQKYGAKVPFLRPNHLASDSSTTEDVIVHAINFYLDNGLRFDYVIYLQPTSPLRRKEDILNAIAEIKDDTELLVSVKETDANPYYVLFEEDNNGVLAKVKTGIFTRRQDCPKVYELNGSIYIVNTQLLLEKGYQRLSMRKIVMEKRFSIDIDDIIDFKIAEILLNEFGTS
jgi:N-acylneuraminate cytidylyltransferase